MNELCKHSVGPRSWFLEIITNTDANSLFFKVCNSTGLWPQNTHNTNTLRWQTAQKCNFLLHLRQTNYNKSTEWYLAAHLSVMSGYHSTKPAWKSLACTSHINFHVISTLIFYGNRETKSYFTVPNYFQNKSAQHLIKL